jgi:hypothetical protein
MYQYSSTIPYGTTVQLYWYSCTVQHRRLCYLRFISSTYESIRLLLAMVQPYCTRSSTVLY